MATISPKALKEVIFTMYEASRAGVWSELLGKAEQMMKDKLCIVLYVQGKKTGEVKENQKVFHSFCLSETPNLKDVHNIPNVVYDIFVGKYKSSSKTDGALAIPQILGFMSEDPTYHFIAGIAIEELQKLGYGITTVEQAISMKKAGKSSFLVELPKPEQSKPVLLVTQTAPESSKILGVPWYGWAIGAVVLYFVIRRK
jgi:hypothetical protein